jgi:hypothetical protein
MSTLWRSLLLAWLGASAPMPSDDATVLGIEQAAEVYQTEQQSVGAMSGALSGSRHPTADSPATRTPRARRA